MTFPFIAKLKKICACKFSAIFDLSTSVSWPNCVKKLIVAAQGRSDTKTRAYDLIEFATEQSGVIEFAAGAKKS